jgi:hypothetical protein
MFVGEILDIKVDLDVLSEGGTPDIKKVNPLVYATKIRDYHQVGDFVAKAFEAGRQT